MAKIISTVQNRIETTKVKRRGIHSKCKTSKLKNSKNYKKPYRGQGR